MKWPLSDLIRVSLELCVINKRVQPYLDGVRLTRNLIHPGLALDDDPIRESEAAIAEEILKMVIDDLQQKVRITNLRQT